MRRLARELSYKIVFSSLFFDESKSLENLINEEDFFTENNIDEETKEYLCKLTNCVLQNKQELINKISSVLQNTTIEKLYKCDLAILLVSTAEYVYLKTADLNKAIIINEAVEIAKKYGENKSSKFVHGVLGQLFKEDI